jgi:N-acyl-D-amino-acid deacylase
MYDLLIRGGTIVDGTGRAPYTGDVAVTADRIAAVGKVEGSARREIDATGAVVAPGWVDVHTHYDGQLTWDPEVSPSGWHGVTTVVVGNCGVGFAPARESERDWLIQLMEGVEDIPGTALAEGISWRWESFPEYLDEVERMPRVLDVAAMVAHGALRAYVLGCDRNNAEPSYEEISLMSKLAREALEAGAIGVSTTRTIVHMAKDGQPAAGTFAKADELIAIGEAMAGLGRRVFSVASEHVFGPGADQELSWMAEISRRARQPVTYMVLDTPFTPGAWKQAIDRGLELNRDGAWLVPQVAGKPASVMVGWDSSYHLFSGHESYQPLASLPFEERLAKLRDPAVRQALLDEPLSFTNPFIAVLHANIANLYQLGDPPDYEPAPERSVAAIAGQQGRKPLEVAYDMMMERDGQELLYAPLLGYSERNFDALREMLLHPSTVLGLADGGAHVGVICDGAMPTFLLTHWVRDRSRGERIRLEKAVQLQTADTASLFGFTDRGRLEPGLLADINVIDFGGLRLGGVTMARDLPAGGKRLVQKANGYIATVKSGAIVRDHDEATGELPGRLVRAAAV